MRTTKQFKKDYPKLTKWIETNLPKVKLKPKVWAAYKKYAELSDKKALWSITNGYKPCIASRIMPKSNGQFIGSKFPNRVFLAKSICEKFEKSDFDNAKMHTLIESTLLHEMVHWGDWKDSVDQAGEEGKAFEKAAYGKDINRYW